MYVRSPSDERDERKKKGENAQFPSTQEHAESGFD
jgi:hypothetical protein